MILETRRSSSLPVLAWSFHARWQFSEWNSRNKWSWTEARRIQRTSRPRCTSCWANPLTSSRCHKLSSFYRNLSLNASFLFKIYDRTYPSGTLKWMEKHEIEQANWQEFFSTYYLFHPTIGRIVHKAANDHINKISSSTLFVVKGFPDSPFTMTL